MLFCLVAIFRNVTPSLNEDLMCTGSSVLILHMFIMLLPVFHIVPKNVLSSNFIFENLLLHKISELLWAPSVVAKHVTS
jgi:hypothetical protein